MPPEALALTEADKKHNTRPVTDRVACLGLTVQSENGFKTWVASWPLTLPSSHTHTGMLMLAGGRQTNLTTRPAVGFLAERAACSHRGLISHNASLDRRLL